MSDRFSSDGPGQRWAGGGGSVEVPPCPGQLPRVTFTEQAGVAFPGLRTGLGEAADPRGPAEAHSYPMKRLTRRGGGDRLSFTVLGYNFVK